MTYRFGPFQLDSVGFLLRRGNQPVSLQPKALDLLLLLAARRGALLTKDDILRTLWPDVNVTDNALTQVVSDLRHALGDSPASPSYIQTVARRGYRFVAPVEEIPSDEPHRQTWGVFDLTDASVSARIGVRETASLDAYRSFTEARLKLEALDPAQVPSAMVDFNRAIALDPRFTLAYVGRAHARFWRFEASRVRNCPDGAELHAAIVDVRRAIELDPDLAEAHAGLALFLSAAGRPEEARDAGRRAVALEPGNWRQLFRLGFAAWGDERLECFRQVIGRYPEFPYTYFGSAMVHIARGDLSSAERCLGDGLAFESESPDRQERFPGRGLHWLLGACRLAAGDSESAHREFDRELRTRGADLYAAEHGINAYDGHGFAFLSEDADTRAAEMFERSLEIVPDHARSLIGLAAVGRTSALDRARRAIQELRANERTSEVALTSSLLLVVERRESEAIEQLDRWLSEAPSGPAGWTLPIEPLLARLKTDPRFAAVRARLEIRAR